MKKKLMFVILAVLALIMPVACSSDDEDENLYTQIVEDKIGHQLVDQAELPEWLSESIEIMKTDPNYIPQFPPRIYQLEWGNETYYYIHSTWNSMRAVTALYKRDGTLFTFTSQTETEDCSKNSRNWKCIFIVE